jgi:hypothetical protein
MQAFKTIPLTLGFPAVLAIVSGGRQEPGSDRRVDDHSTAEQPIEKGPQKLLK